MTPIVTIAASAGGLAPLLRIIGALPAGCRASIFVVQHIGAHPSILPEILSRSGRLAAAFGRDGEEPEPGRVYVAPRTITCAWSAAASGSTRGRR
ncbi:chemotaxis response regulator CheB [Methylobacterium sp. BE186]|nr:chemotaxis protein CheB [Methylobacterium sp. BE186]MDR7035820.1 chemotaxis response regulator CheB [Methylobacterium sp. BE186]